MQIIIPITGYGSRFKKAGYKKLKPFIKVHDKPMIEWVVKMFPGDKDNIIFLCKQTDLDSLPYIKTELNRIAPNAKIFSVKDWKKMGPIYDVLHASDIIYDHLPTIVCYCDYYMHWDYHKFKKEVIKRDSDGAIPCYTGFHPHLIPKKNLYASCKTDKNDNLIEIREKFSWEEDKTKTCHSPGIYYFKNGKILKEYSQRMINAKDSINEEYYASLPFNYLVKDKLKVWCPNNVTSFCQWGTPEDLEEHLFWIDNIRRFTV